MPKKKSSSSTSKKKDKTILEEKLIENLVELQKVHTDLAEKFDKLTKEISNLLQLFEGAARSFAKNAPQGDYEKDKEFLEKIDKLLDQNKTIAKGLTLMEDRMKSRIYGSQPQQNQPVKEESYKPSISSNRPLPKF